MAAIIQGYQNGRIGGGSFGGWLQYSQGRAL